MRRAIFVIALFVCGWSVALPEDEVPGRWGVTDTSQPADIVWPANWVGAKNLRAQWFKIFAESPQAWIASGYLNHAKGEPPDNTYYLWRFDRPVPEGTKILIEGDFPHARMMSFQVCAPWNNKAIVSSDGSGLPEVHLLDEDIVPDPGHSNPFLPGADRNAKRRHFHITFELRDGDPAILNPKAVLPPYRAPGNLRYGCTGTVAPGSVFGADKTHGPVVYMRMYLPDRYEPYGGVEPPVIRLQFPGQNPMLAPISRSMPVNLRKFVEGYSLEENPAGDNGLSLKEEEAKRALRQYAKAATTAQPTNAASGARRIIPLSPDGTISLYKTFQTPWLVTYLKDYINDPEGCRTKLPRRYRYAFGDMGPEASPPGNDEHVSNHHSFNTYMGSAANLAPGELLVFRGKAPITPRTLNGDAKMGSSDQLRYWNFTLQTGTPTRLTPVINITDETVALDKNGRYLIVIGRERDRPPNATEEHGVTWRPWPVGDVLSINMRIMSTSSNTWEHAPQRVTWKEADFCTFGKNPQAVRARMGEYFPEGRYLTTAQVAALVSGAPMQIAVDTSVSRPVSPLAAPTDPGSRDATISVAGVARSYRLHLPTAFSASKKFPVVMALHSGQSSGAEMESLSGLSELADRKNFIAVYPNAIGRYKGKLYWNDGRVPEVDDVRFIGALIDELASKYSADTKRIYLTGISNGASMTNRLGIELSDRIAAIAPVAGTIGVRVADRWKPKRTMPVMYIHGTDDPLAYYTGGSAGTYRGSALAAEEYVQWWVRQNGCAPGSVASETLPQVVGDGTSVKRYQYGECKDGGEVVFYRIENGGHTWPGGKPWLPEKIAGKTSGNLDASAQMWAFFSRYSRK